MGNSFVTMALKTTILTRIKVMETFFFTGRDPFDFDKVRLSDRSKTYVRLRRHYSSVMQRNVQSLLR